MNLNIVPITLGPVMTNAFLVADPETLNAVVIDPAWDGRIIAAEARKHSWAIQEIWVTHAHFDHMGGTGELVEAVGAPLDVALHPDELPLWRAKGGAPFFGIDFEPCGEPNRILAHRQVLRLGKHRVEVRHAPGHTPGHVMFYFQDAGVLFSGDVIFQGSVGRTDLPGGDWNALLVSIQEQVLTLPDETRILSGHGPETTVGHERATNPFLLYI